MKRPKLSVVVPTCDRPNLVVESLESVSAQTRLPDEVIVVDNGNSATALDREWPFPLRLIRALPRFGVAQARNLGSVLASGDYISFLDDDDRWDPEYLAEVERTVIRSGAGVVLGRLRDLEQGGPIAGKQSEFQDAADLRQLLLRRNPGAVGSNITVAREGLFQTSGFDPWLTPSEDKALVLELLLRDIEPARAESAWVDFRSHHGERLTAPRSHRRGKVRFIRKYAAHMSWRIRVGNVAQLARIQVSFIGQSWR